MNKTNAHTEKTKQDLGERCAERMINDGYVPKRFRGFVAAIINQQLEQQNLGNETPPASEMVNREIGLAPCPFCGAKLEPSGNEWHIEHARGCILSGIPELRHLRTLVFWNKRAPLTATPKEVLGER